LFEKPYCVAKKFNIRTRDEKTYHAVKFFFSNTDTQTRLAKLADSSRPGGMFGCFADRVINKSPIAPITKTDCN
jgi:hypothetical protein